MCFCFTWPVQDAEQSRAEQMGRPTLRTRFIISGFSSFNGVARNPTEVIVSQLEDYLNERSQKGGIAGGAELVSCTVLKVAAKEVHLWLLERAAELAEEEPARIVFVHFGVDVHAPCHKLESQAKNCALFRVPDEAGWQPCSVPIDASKPLSCCLKTNLPLDSVASALRADNFAVKVSKDAGLFVCNWTYYCSLQISQKHPKHCWHSVFVHCPSFSVSSEKEQIRLAAAVLDKLGALFSSTEGAHSPRGALPSPRGLPCRLKSLEEGEQPSVMSVKA